MWCSHCQQDVRGVASGESGRYACPRCGVDLSIRADAPTKDTVSPHGQPGAAAEARNPPAAGPASGPWYDGWELEEQLRHIQRVLSLDGDDRPAGEPSQATSQENQIRLDVAHAGAPGWHRSTGRKSRRRRQRRGRRTTGWLPLCSRAVLSVGLMASACGGVLLGWSFVTGRHDLWSIGMPITLAGQILLLVGFVLQLDRLWHDNRDAVAKLEDVNQRLKELKTTTSMLGTTHSSAATSFYAHMAGGASPQLLLADLKSQLDLLAVKLGEAER